MESLRTDSPLEALAAVEREWLTPAQIAPVLGADPNYIRFQAHKDPSKLGFPVIVIGSHVKIPRQPFILFMKGEHHEKISL